jgi:TetR/AcrR family transcriptional regulator, transcriptional repressor for nem operon
MAIGTRDALVQAAESLMRTKGYAAFSYADLAEAVGIKKASIHHHFPAKEDLGTAIVEGYIARVRCDLERIEKKHNDVIGRLEAFFQVFRASSEGGLLPLCGALAAEMSALPAALQESTRGFFELQLQWLTARLDEGIARAEIPGGSGAKEKAFLLLSVLEGSSLISWVTRESHLHDHMIRLIVERA